MFASPVLADAALDRRTQLHKLMVGWRRRLRPQDVALLDGGRSLCEGQVSQEVMAAVTGVSPKWYASLERGNLHRNYSDEFLERVAVALKLDSGERRILYWLVKCQEPPQRAGPSEDVNRRDPPLSAGLRTFVTSQPWPAFVVNAAWEIVIANEATALWFDGLALEGNFMRWMLCHPSARRQIGQWETVARLMLGQLTAQHAKLPEHQCVQELIRDVLEHSEQARRWWTSEPGVWLHDDGNRRTVLLPGAATPTTVEIVSTTPLRDVHLRTFTIVPLDGFIPHDCQAIAAVGRGPA